jgi:hypothetical protein
MARREILLSPTTLRVNSAEKPRLTQPSVGAQAQVHKIMACATSHRSRLPIEGGIRSLHLLQAMLSTLAKIHDSENNVQSPFIVSVIRAIEGRGWEEKRGKRFRVVAAGISDEASADMRR